MSSKRYPEEFKIEAVRQVVERGHSACFSLIERCCRKGNYSEGVTLLECQSSNGVIARHLSWRRLGKNDKSTNQIDIAVAD